ncbi:hypothetical protein [Candidatus Protofrankia californiensis]|nr:hypothetical protein [Candidatus Protofrankia californiensis]
MIYPHRTMIRARPHDELSVMLGKHRLTYDDEVGLRHERGGT